MPTTSSRLQEIRDSTAELRRQIEDHVLYTSITRVEHLRLFMQAHVFAVWDFMSLLKALQQSLTSVSVPWVPSRHPNSCRLINEIVLAEESDTYRDTHLSHFEIYRNAMEEAGADTGPITGVLAMLDEGVPLGPALTRAGVPEEAEAFVRSTFEGIHFDKPHIMAAAFTFGREDLIPAMFRQIVRDLRTRFDGLGAFEYYLDRHIEVDGDSHGPMAMLMVEDLCRDDDRRWSEASAAARTALEARLRLWDGIARRISAA